MRRNPGRRPLLVQSGAFIGLCLLAIPSEGVAALPGPEKITPMITTTDFSGTREKTVARFMTMNFCKLQHKSTPKFSSIVFSPPPHKSVVKFLVMNFSGLRHKSVAGFMGKDFSIWLTPAADGRILISISAKSLIGISPPFLAGADAPIERVFLRPQFMADCMGHLRVAVPVSGRTNPVWSATFSLSPDGGSSQLYNRRTVIMTTSNHAPVAPTGNNATQTIITTLLHSMKDAQRSLLYLESRDDQEQLQAARISNMLTTCISKIGGTA